MKRIILSALVLVILVSMMSYGIQAATYTNIFERNMTVEYDENPDGQRALLVKYIPGTSIFGIIISNAQASAELSVSNDATGSAYVNIRNADGELITASSSTISNNAVFSGYASTGNCIYATEVIHYAYRDSDNWGIEDWRYTYKQQ